MTIVDSFFKRTVKFNKLGRVLLAWPGFQKLRHLEKLHRNPLRFFDDVDSSLHSSAFEVHLLIERCEFDQFHHGCNQ